MRSVSRPTGTQTSSRKRGPLASSAGLSARRPGQQQVGLLHVVGDRDIGRAGLLEDLRVGATSSAVWPGRSDWTMSAAAHSPG